MDNDSFNMKSSKKKVLFLLVLIATILLCTMPMKLAPYWNGEITAHRNQYELCADAFLEGHLNIEYDDYDKRLEEMENPYDPDLRRELGIKYHWDHAFYKGKYYMYFGVAPVIFLFIPYKVITGHTLPTCEATMIITGLFIVGLFMLFYNICKYLYPKTKYGIYLALAAAFSCLSVWICTGRPALYCTAIISGLCTSIWSFYFYLKAVYGNKLLNKAIIYATIGGFFGAITFACRPPLGFINLLAIPLVITFFKKYGLNKKVILKVLIVLIPYLIVGTLLMLYNYARFENVFEFGQSYQITLADQHNYLGIFARFDIVKILSGILYNFLEIKLPTKMFTFPYLNISGAFINYPILLLPYLLFIKKDFRDNLKNKDIKWLYICLMTLPFIITIIDILGSPFLTERYRLDIYFILGVLTFICIINYYEIFKFSVKYDLYKYITYGVSILVIITSILLFFVPCDYNYTAYYSDIIPKINDALNIFK